MTDRSARVILAAAWVAVAGCGSSPRPDARPEFSPGSGVGSASGTFPTADLDALLPTGIRVHSLTRLERAPTKPGSPLPAGASAPWQIACHIELKDAFGHTTKGLGRLRIELYRPVSDRPGGSQAQDATWTIDLREPGENARVYDDLITRTYTVYLASLPGWLQDWATRAEQRRAALSAPPGSDDDTVTLKAYFITQDRSGRERVFESTYRLPG